MCKRKYKIFYCNVDTNLMHDNAIKYTIGVIHITVVFAWQIKVIY